MATVLLLVGVSSSGMRDSDKPDFTLWQLPSQIKSHMNSYVLPTGANSHRRTCGRRIS